MSETSPETVTGADAGASATPEQSAAGSQPATVTTNAEVPLREGAKMPNAAEEVVKEPAKVEEPPKEGEPAAKEFKLPDAYKDKSWASKIKSEEDLYKQLDTLDALKGKKTVVPDFTKATPAEIEEYYKQTRPETTDAYSFADGTDDTIKKAIGDSLFKHGVNPFQANAVIKDFQAAEQESVKQLYTAAGMDSELEKSFGDSWKETGGATARVLKENLSTEDAALLDKLPNSALGLVYRAAHAITKAYGIKESGAHTEAGAGAIKPQSADAEIATLRTQLSNLTTQPHTAEQKQAIIDKINNHYVQKVKAGAK